MQAGARLRAGGPAAQRGAARPGGPPCCAAWRHLLAPAHALQQLQQPLCPTGAGATRSRAPLAQVLGVLDDNARSAQEAIQAAAVRALHAYARAYCAAPGAAPRLAQLAQHYSARLRDPNVAIRRGAALALGALPAAVLLPELQQVVCALCGATAPEEDPEQRDVESRANAVAALGRVCQEVWGSGADGPDAAAGSLPRRSSDDGGAQQQQQRQQQQQQQRAGGEAPPVVLVLQHVVPALMAALQDYTTDNRGDVGSWVREASLKVSASGPGLACSTRS